MLLLDLVLGCAGIGFIVLSEMNYNSRPVGSLALGGLGIVGIVFAIGNAFSWQLWLLPVGGVLMAALAVGGWAMRPGGYKPPRD